MLGKHIVNQRNHTVISPVKGEHFVTLLYYVGRCLSIEYWHSDAFQIAHVYAALRCPCPLRLDDFSSVRRKQEIE